MNLKAMRAKLLADAQDMIAKAKAENRDLTTKETAEIEAKTAEIKDLDKTIEAQAKGKALLDSFKDDGPDDDGDTQRGYLKTARTGQMLASQMRGYSKNANVYAKGLVPGGETVVTVPIVNNVPTPGALTLEHAPRLIELIPAVSRPAANYSILRQATVATPGAASVVAPGDTKPTKKLGVARVDSRLRVVAVLSEPIDKFLLEDAGNLQTWAATELGEAIWDAIETEVLTGTGTGEHFTGLANTSGIQTQAFTTDRITTLAAALSKLTTFGITPDLIALAPADVLALQTTRNTSGAFDLGGAIDAAASTAWGVRYVSVPGLTEGTAYAIGNGSLELSHDGSGLRVDWGTPGDSFTKNQLVARVEGRFNLDVLKPHAIVRATLTAG